MKKPKTFEEGMAQLQLLLDELLNPDTPLDTAVKQYAQTAELVAFCNETLKNATLQMEEIDVELAKLDNLQGE